MELKTQTRTILGKKVKGLRNDGQIPAELYGRGLENKHLSVSEKDFLKIFKEAGENTVINLVTEDNDKLPVIISNVSVNSLNDKVNSIDFHQIRMDEKIEAEIPIELTGEAPAAKKGLNVVKVMNEIKVSAVPLKLPHEFVVDIKSLIDEGDAIYVKDLKADEDVKFLVPLDSVIVIANKIKEEKEETPPPAPATETAEAVTTAETGSEGNKSEN